MPDINIKKVQINVLGVFAIIFGLLIWFLNTDFYLRKDYLDFKKTEFNTTLLFKIDENPVKFNSIYLKNGTELKIRREIFDKLKIGDSVIKKANSDYILFKTQIGVLIDDYNGFKRKKYLESLK